MTLKYVLSGNTIVKNINLFLTIDNINFKFHTLLRIPQEDWDTEKQRPKNIYLKNIKRLIVNWIFLRKNSLYMFIRNLKKKRQSIREPFQRCYINSYYRTRAHILRILYCFIWKIILEIEKTFICYSTYKRYKVFYNLIQRFEGYAMKHLL